MGGFPGGAPPPGGGGYPPGPPGGYGPPMPPPPPPPRTGLSGAQIALIVVVAVLVLGGGCTTCLCLAAARSASKAVTPVEQPVRTPTPSQASNAKESEWITATRPYVKFRAPVGWSTEITQNKEWGIFKSPARDAVFAFTTFNQPGESTARLGKAASVLGVSDIDWRSPRAGTVGREHFNARVADGSCNFKGPGGYIWYATVDSGSSDQILLIFTVAASAPPARRAEAQAAIDSLQRR